MLAWILTIVYALIPFILSLVLDLSGEQMGTLYILFLLGALIVYMVVSGIRNRGSKVSK